MEPLREASANEVLERGVRGYIYGRGWMIWRHSPTLGGLILWGPQSDEQAAEIIRVCSEGLGSMATIDPNAPFLALLDLRRAGGIDVSAFSVFHSWLVEVNKQNARLRVVMLCDPSPASASLMGLVQLSAPKIVQAVADDLDPILAKADAPSGLMRLLDETLEALMAPSAVALLRAALHEANGQLTLQKAARSLGMSVRTLQRGLEKERTTFERERAMVRKVIYEKLVADPSLKIDAVASALGFGSLRAFSTAFRRAVGVSPRAFRLQASRVNKSR
jgi:AraC-like DNA-binding protein